MRVAITGATGQVGTLLAERLAAGPHEGVPLGRDDDWEAAIRSADGVAHLAGTLQPKGGDDYHSANVATTERVAEAIDGSGVGRVVLLSYGGAAPGEPNEYLRSKAEAERILLAHEVPATIIRCAHIFGPPARPGPTATPLLQPKRGPVRVLGSGRQRIAPLYVGDVVDAVERALGGAEAADEILDLVGPQEMSMDEFVRALNGGAVRISHLPRPLARALGRLMPALTPALVDLLLRDSLGGAKRSAAEVLGLELRRVGEIWPA